MQTFQQWLEAFQDPHTATGFFNEIVDNPTNHSLYLIAADYLEDENLPDFAELLRLLISYRTSPNKASITKRLKKLLQHPVFQQITSVTYSNQLKKQIYMLRTAGEEGNEWAYTYDAMRDRRNWVDNKPNPRYQNHPEPDVPFINSQFNRHHTGRTIDTFPAEIIAAMIFYILIINNPEIDALIKKSKALSQTHALGISRTTYERT